MNVLAASLDGMQIREAVFVPAVMSAGLLFSIVTIVRDVLHDHRRPGRQRRVAIAGAVIARHTVSGRPSSEAVDHTIRPRVTYLLIALSGLGVSTYIALGAFLNYTRTEGYLSDIAWLLALSALTAFVIGAIGVVGAVLFATWPHPPRWVGGLLVTTPLGQAPDLDASRSQRRFLIGWGAIMVGLCFGLLTIGIATSHLAFQRTDQWIADRISGIGLLDDLRALDWLGRTDVAVALALLVGVATLRCLPFAVVYLSSVVGTLGIDALIKTMVDRPRPTGTTLSALTESYPSGHIAQIVIITAFVPLAIEVLTDLRWHTHLVGSLLGATVVIAGVTRIEEGWHWPSDVAGGALLGAVVALSGHWLLESAGWHQRCHSCPWVPHEHQPLGAVHIPDGVADDLRRGALAWSALAIGGFAGLGALRGIPRNPDNDLLGAQIEAPVTLFALAVLVIAWAVAIHWNGAGAVGLVAGGGVLAVVSSVAYHPVVSLLIVSAFLLPAVALWLAWQHDQSRRAMIVLASVTTLLLIGVYSSSASVYGRFFGSQHPQSSTAALPVDRVEWVLAGAVTADGFEVHAMVDDDIDTTVRLVVTDAAGHVAATSPMVEVSPSRIVALRVDGLEPATRYDYTVEADGVLDTQRGVGRIRTFADGPHDIRVAVASCARSGSNGKVFDAIRAIDPDLYIVTGDLHYGNPDEADPDLFRRLFHRVLTSSAQSALYRSVPFAYVWDDHDYGPNDADGSAPTRDTARTVYREVVPSFTSPDGPINQAFTAGRVRFVITDTRSARSEDSMLGEEQLGWFLDQLGHADEYALVVWVNPDPWIAGADPSRDDWGAHADERERILQVLDDEEVDNLVMLSGDAHMVAIDDGTNTGGFPLLQAAALDRPGTVKGGPYSEGTFPGAGQFGLLEVHDDGGDTIEVTLSGRTWEGEELVRKSFQFTVG